jgi:hypothetical protein
MTIGIPGGHLFSFTSPFLTSPFPTSLSHSRFSSPSFPASFIVIPGSTGNPFQKSSKPFKKRKTFFKKKKNI